MSDAEDYVAQLGLVRLPLGDGKEVFVDPTSVVAVCPDTGRSPPCTYVYTAADLYFAVSATADDTLHRLAVGVAADMVRSRRVDPSWSPKVGK